MKSDERLPLIRGDLDDAVSGTSGPQQSRRCHSPAEYFELAQGLGRVNSSGSNGLQILFRKKLG
jgi:hypothetical protein